mgnify:CR=1 FL=1
MSRNGEQGLMASRRRMWFYQKRQQRTDAEPEPDKGIVRQKETNDTSTLGKDAKE